MSPSRSRRHHPLTAASTALEHLFLRPFGFRLADEQPAEKPSGRGDRRSAPPAQR
jgi:hypothetical protein